jgi:hypothetical protein
MAIICTALEAILATQRTVRWAPRKDGRKYAYRRCWRSHFQPTRSFLTRGSWNHDEQSTPSTSCSHVTLGSRPLLFRTRPSLVLTLPTPLSLHHDTLPRAHATHVPFSSPRHPPSCSRYPRARARLSPARAPAPSTCRSPRSSRTFRASIRDFALPFALPSRPSVSSSSPLPLTRPRAPRGSHGGRARRVWPHRSLLPTALGLERPDLTPQCMARGVCDPCA